MSISDIANRLINWVPYKMSLYISQMYENTGKIANPEYRFNEDVAESQYEQIKLLEGAETKLQIPVSMLEDGPGSIHNNQEMLNTLNEIVNQIQNLPQEEFQYQEIDLDFFRKEDEKLTKELEEEIELSQQLKKEILDVQKRLAKAHFTPQDGQLQADK